MPPALFTLGSHTCVHLSVCVCVTDKEVIQGLQLKIIGINFINAASLGKYIQSGEIINLCSTSHPGLLLQGWSEGYRVVKKVKIKKIRREY